jgi:menaquinone-9 beta-reductase
MSKPAPAPAPDYDVAIVGASIAGCAAAALLGQAGARVALVEKRPDPAAFKRVCGHFIQASAAPVLERLGVLDELDRLGASRGRARLWTRFGWTKFARGRGESISVRRELLDPVLRRRAAATPGVELIPGTSAVGLVERDVRVDGLELKGRAGSGWIRARAVVGADGRGSRLAEMAGIATRSYPNVRFAYWGYFEGPRALPAEESARLWLLEPDAAIVTPTDSGLQMYVAFPHHSRRDAFRSDPEGALREFFAGVPDPPPIGASTLAGPIVGKLDLTNERRRAAAPGIALIGDAAMTADPLAAVGCGFALQSASWLADELAPALDSDRAVDRALRRYRRVHARRLGGHMRLLNDTAANEGALKPPQRLLFGAAAADRTTAERLADFADRWRGPAVLLSPRTLARAAFVRRRLRSPVQPTVAAGSSAKAAGPPGPA